jgi:uncharacterized membrane protein YbhN (UPF0104 family)
MSNGYARLLVGFGISAVLLALLLRTIDVPTLINDIGSADLRFVLPAIALYFAALWLRSVRWGFLLPVSGRSTSTLFRALTVGFTVNNLLPMRMGELARAYLMARWCGVAYGNTLASVVVERVLDGLALALLLLTALFFVPAPPPYLLALGLAVGGAFCGGALLLALAAWRSDGIAGMGRVIARPLPSMVGAIVQRLAASFAHGLRLVRGWRLLAKLAGLSVLAWACELGLFYVLMLGFSLPGSLPLAFLGGSAANFATLVPSSPGYVGTFDGTLVKVLADTAGLSADRATAYTVVVHATLFIPVTVVGLLILWRAHISFGQLTRLGRRRAAPAPVAEPVAR